MVFSASEMVSAQSYVRGSNSVLVGQRKAPRPGRAIVIGTVLCLSAQAVYSLTGTEWELEAGRCTTHCKYKWSPWVPTQPCEAGAVVSLTEVREVRLSGTVELGPGPPAEKKKARRSNSCSAAGPLVLPSGWVSAPAVAAVLGSW